MTGAREPVVSVGARFVVSSSTLITMPAGEARAAGRLRNSDRIVLANPETRQLRFGMIENIEIMSQAKPKLMKLTFGGSSCVVPSWIRLVRAPITDRVDIVLPDGLPSRPKNISIYAVIPPMPAGSPAFRRADVRVGSVTIGSTQPLFFVDDYPINTAKVVSRLTDSFAPLVDPEIDFDIALRIAGAGNGWFPAAGRVLIAES